MNTTNTHSRNCCMATSGEYMATRPIPARRNCSPRLHRKRATLPTRRDSQQGTHRAGTGEKPQEVEGAGQGRACLPGYQTHLWLCQGQLSRHGEERQQVVHRGGAGKLVHGATPLVATFAGKVRLMNGILTGMTDKLPYGRSVSRRFRCSQQMRTRRFLLRLPIQTFLNF